MRSEGGVSEAGGREKGEGTHRFVLNCYLNKKCLHKQKKGKQREGFKVIPFNYSIYGKNIVVSRGCDVVTFLGIRLLFLRKIHKHIDIPRFNLIIVKRKESIHSLREM